MTISRSSSFISSTPRPPSSPHSPRGIERRSSPIGPPISLAIPRPHAGPSSWATTWPDTWVRGPMPHPTTDSSVIGSVGSFGAVVLPPLHWLSLFSLNRRGHFVPTSPSITTARFACSRKRGSCGQERIRVPYQTVSGWKNVFLLSGHQESDCRAGNEKPRGAGRGAEKNRSDYWARGVSSPRRANRGSR